MWRFPTIKHDIKDYFFIANPLSTPLAHPSVMLRRSSLIKHNIEYNESYLRGQDFRLWYDILNIGDISNVPEILLKYRLSKSQIGAKYARDQNLIRIKIYLEYVNKLMKSDYDTLSKGLYEELKKNKRIIIDKISKNHYDSLIVFFLCNTTETLKRNFLFSLECSMFFNFNIRLKEKVKCILNIINFKI
ncbi:hypothetical protein BK387_30070 [Escherichia coli]|nr:hypothetical protein BK387_30070 [Escherichia coli]